MAVEDPSPCGVPWLGVGGCGNGFGGCEIGLRQTGVDGGFEGDFRSDHRGCGGVFGHGCRNGYDHYFVHCLDRFGIGIAHGSGGCGKASRLVVGDYVSDVSHYLVGCGSGGGWSLLHAPFGSVDSHTELQKSGQRCLRHVC